MKAALRVGAQGAALRSDAQCLGDGRRRREVKKPRVANAVFLQTNQGWINVHAPFAVAAGAFVILVVSRTVDAHARRRACFLRRIAAAKIFPVLVIVLAKQPGAGEVVRPIPAGKHADRKYTTFILCGL